MAGRSGALSIKPSEGSRSRVRWTRPMDFQSIFGWKSLPEAGFGKNVVIDADRCSGSRIHLDHPNAGRSVVQDHSSDHRFKRLHLTRASVRRASGFVLTGYPETWSLACENHAVLTRHQQNEAARAADASA